MDTKLERVTLEVPEKLAEGAVHIVYEYVGVLNDLMKGFYASSYKTVTDGVEVEHTMATTQFEPGDCRRALPCWDEPIHKATFDVQLTVPQELTALSNMQVKDTTNTTDGLKTVTFATSPVMSTYLLAFVVGDVEYVEASVTKVNSGDTTLLRVYTIPGQKHKGEFALDVAAKCLAVYERYFEVDYPLVKCDLIAIPDFQCGAMENWGLITYRETTLLCTAESSFKSREYVALVVAHELAHQWFGNLVTMEWWKELWLNESFATFIEYDTVDKLYPSWKSWNRFISEDYDSALNVDALESSHPVEVDVFVSRTEEIDEIFDGISYSKGCSLMRMLHDWIGAEPFRKALAAYIKEFSYKNATTTDLFNAFEKASNMPVTKVMSDWTQKQGYPVLHTRRLPEGVEITQNRFLAARAPTAEEDSQIWSIPMTIETDQGSQKVLLSERTQVVPIPDNAVWVNVNAGQFAVVRVHYETAMLTALTTAVKDGKVSAVDVSGTINNLAASARAGVLPAVEVLTFIDACIAQDDTTVWQAIHSAVVTLEPLVKGTEGEALLDAYAVRLLARLSEQLTWDSKDGDSDRTKELRGLVCSWLAAAGSKPALAEADARYHRFIASEDEKDLPSDVRGGVYSAQVRNETGRAAWDTLRARFENEDNEATERGRCLRALAKTRDVALLEETLAYAFGGKVRAQNIPTIVYSLLANSVSAQMTFKYTTENWSKLLKQYGGYLMMSIGSFYAALVGDDDCAALEAWWATVSEDDKKCADSSLKQSIEELKLTRAFKKRDQAALITYLKGL